MDTNTPTLATVIPAKARRVVYAVAGFVVPTTLVTIGVTTDGFQPSDLGLILTTAASSAGFPLALSNTPR